MSLPSQFSHRTIRTLSSGSLYAVVRRSAPLGSVFFLIPRTSGLTQPVDGATSTCALGDVRQPNDHLPPPHAARQHKRFRKRALERAELRYSRDLGQSSRRMPARLPLNRDACARPPRAPPVVSDLKFEKHPRLGTFKLKRPSTKCVIEIPTSASVGAGRGGRALSSPQRRTSGDEQRPLRASLCGHPAAWPLPREQTQNGLERRGVANEKPVADCTGDSK